MIAKLPIILVGQQRMLSDRLVLVRRGSKGYPDV